tara:strand:+ start:1632 stop:2384 length:753 start_codon:yes stop_codon:yes gene_type:complete
LAEGVDVRTIVIIVTSSTPRIGRKEARPFIHTGRTAGCVIIKVVTTTPFTDITAHIFASTTLLLTFTLFTNFKSPTIIVAVAARNALSSGRVTIGSHQGAIRVRLTTREFTNPFGITFGALRTNKTWGIARDIKTTVAMTDFRHPIARSRLTGLATIHTLALQRTGILPANFTGRTIGICGAQRQTNPVIRTSLAIWALQIFTAPNGRFTNFNASRRDACPRCALKTRRTGPTALGAIAFNTLIGQVVNP